MRRQGILLGIAVAVGGIVVGGLQWHAERERRQAILALSPTDRLALVERTLRNLDALCPEAVLSRECEAEARLLLLVPECDAECRRQASGYLPHATR